MAEGGQKWLIFRSKSGHNGRLVPGQGTNLETVLCAISPPNTWDSMIIDYMGQHDYMEQHDVRPLLRSVCIADSYIRGHFTLFHTGDGYFTFLGWLFYILGKKPPRSLHTRAGDRLHIYCN